MHKTILMIPYLTLINQSYFFLQRSLYECDSRQIALNYWSKGGKYVHQMFKT